MRGAIERAHRLMCVAGARGVEDTVWITRYSVETVVGCWAADGADREGRAGTSERSRWQNEGLGVDEGVVISLGNGPVRG